MSRSASIGDARNRLSALVELVSTAHERIVLTSHGRPRAALIGLEDLAALESLRLGRPRDDSALRAAERFVARLKRARRGVPLPDSCKDLEALREGER